MKKIFIISIFTIFLLVSKAQAAPATIFYAKGTSEINSIKVETSINPNNNSNTVWVEYSTDNTLAVVNQTPHIIIDSGRDAKVIFIDINNLESNTMYFLKVVANNGKENAISETFAVLTKKDPNQKVEVRTTNTIEENIINSDTEETSKKVKPGKFALFILNLFPSGILNWIALIIIILMLVVLFIKLRIEHQSHY